MVSPLFSGVAFPPSLVLLDHALSAPPTACPSLVVSPTDSLFRHIPRTTPLSFQLPLQQHSGEQQQLGSAESDPTAHPPSQRPSSSSASP